MSFFKGFLAAAIVFPHMAFSAEGYRCERTYFSNSSLVSNEFAAALMPQKLIISLDRSSKVALTSATGTEYPLTIKGNTASHRLKESQLLNHRFLLNFKKLKSKGEITWGITHSDDNYQKSAPARYRCKTL